MNGQAGKGSHYRPVDRKKFEENWDRIWGDKDDVGRPGDSSSVEEEETGQKDYGQIEPFKSSDPVSRSIEAEHRS